jgi:hypothetical protein
MARCFVEPNRQTIHIMQPGARLADIVAHFRKQGFRITGVSRVADPQLLAAINSADSLAALTDLNPQH